jgi:type III secretion protein Q
MTPPRLSLNEARARGVLGRQGSALPLDLGAPWVLSLHPQPLSEPAAPWAQTWTLLAEWAGARFALRVPEAALVQWTESAAGHRFELAGLPPELRALALEQVWRHVAAALAPLRRGSARLLATAAPDEPVPEAPGPHRLAAALHSADGAQHFAAEISTDALGLLLAAGALSQRPVAAAEAAPDTPLACRFEIGRSVLSRAELAALRLGDVVLVADRSCERAADGTVQLWLATQGHGGLPVRLAGHRVDILQPWSPRPMSPAPETPDAADEQPLALDSVPVSLSFDLGEIALPLGQLGQLAVGQSFDLGRPLAGAVRVRANGALVALGELVEIDGRLGVALTQLGP